MTEQRFRSKIDRWLAAVASIGVIVPAAILVFVWQSGDARGSEVATLVAVSAFMIALQAWLFLGTSYIVTDHELLVRCGPVRRRVALRDITGITPTSSILSAPALSLDRLEVAAGSHTVVISPLDKDGFIAAIRRINPGAGGAEGPADSAAAGQTLHPALVGVAFIHLVVFSLIGVSLYFGSKPPRVEVSADRVIVESRNVPISSIVAVTLERALPSGLRKRNGVNAGKILRGRFSLAAAGNGDVYTNRQGPPYVLIRTQNDFLLLNLESPDKTRAFYEEVARRRQAGR